MLFALSGLKGAGKDTVADYMVAKYGFTKIAFADALKDMVLTINPVVLGDISQPPIRLQALIAEKGWDYAKRQYPEVRRLLQVFGTEIVRNNFGENVWINLLSKKYHDLELEHYVITDCRFPNEADFVHARHGDIVWIDRPGLTSDGHASESLLMRGKADYILHNDETIEELHEDLRLLLFMRGVDPIE